MHTSNDQSIAESIVATARETGSSMSLGTPLGSWTGTELADATVLIAHTLGRRYASNGAPVLILMTGDPSTVAAFLATDLTGRTAVLLHPSSTVEQVRLAAVATCAQLFLQSTRAPLDTGELGGQTEELQGLIWTELPNVEGETPEASSRHRPSGFVCQQTSGTMGHSKLSLRTRAAVRTEIEALRRALALRKADIVLCGSAVSHSYGCIGGLLTPLLVGATVMLAPNPEETRAVLLRSEPSIIYGLGPTYAQLMDVQESLDEHFQNVRFAFSAGAPLTEGLFDRFQERFAVPIRQDYGTSESGTISLDLTRVPRPQTVGLPLPHLNIRLRPPVDIPLEPGEEGEVMVRSAALARGYLEAGRLSPCTDQWGWYGTQDAGSWVDGSLSISRRLRPLPFINGERVDLDEVERSIQKMPGVLEVVVWPESDGDRSVLIAGVATQVHTAEEVRSWALQRLPRNWLPDRITVLERLPRSPAGKLLNRYMWVK